MLFRIATCLVIFASFLTVLFSACRKGDFLAAKKYMKLKIEAFYTDSALFSFVQLNDSVIMQQASANAGGYTTILNKELDATTGDSAWLRVLIVKKNAENIEIDSMIHFTNNNEFLLLQLDPKTKPFFINKKLENATAVKPGKDSIKVRLYYNVSDSVKYPADYPTVTFRGKTVDSFNLQLYSLLPENGEYKKENLKKDMLIRSIKINRLNDYFSVYAGSGEGMVYGYDIIDIKSSRIIQKHEVGTYNGFVKGNFELGSRSGGLFQTCRITKRSIYDDEIFEEVMGVNTYLLFGLN